MAPLSAGPTAHPSAEAGGLAGPTAHPSAEAGGTADGWAVSLVGVALGAACVVPGASSDL